MKNPTTLLISLLLLPFLGCSKVEYNHKTLGFSSAAEMHAAFAKGYHTKKKLDEMLPPPAVNPLPISPELLPTSTGTTESPKESSESSSPSQDISPYAPSFDCVKASNKVEKLICGDRELSMLDVELSKVYRAAQETSADKDQLKRDQISWIKLSRACEDQSCLKNALEMRLKQLKK